MGTSHFCPLCGSLFFLVLEAIPFHFSGKSHTQLKSGDEGCQRGFLPQFILQVLRTEQQLLVLPGDVLPEGMVGVVQRSLQLRAVRLPAEPLVQSLHVVVHVCRLLCSDTTYHRKKK